MHGVCLVQSLSMSAAAVKARAVAAYSYARLAVNKMLIQKTPLTRRRGVRTPHHQPPLPASQAGGCQVTTPCDIQLLTANCVNSSAVNVGVWELSVNFISFVLL